MWMYIVHQKCIFKLSVACVSPAGGKPAAEFATKNYLVQLANILSVKDPSYSALKLVLLTLIHCTSNSTVDHLEEQL